MLTGLHDLNFKQVGTLASGKNDRDQFDRLRSGADNCNYANFSHIQFVVLHPIHRTMVALAMSRQNFELLMT